MNRYARRLDADTIWAWNERFAVQPDIHECTITGLLFTEPKGSTTNVSQMTKQQLLAHADENYGIDLLQYVEHIPGKDYTPRLRRAVVMMRGLDETLRADGESELDRRLKMRLALVQHRKQTA